MNRPLAIYAGYVVRYPLGGSVLTESHCMAGLQRLGYDVVYVEESGSGWAPCYNPTRNEMTTDPSYGIGVLQEVLRARGLERRWCYVDSERHYHGLTKEDLLERCRRATVFFCRANVNWLEEFRACKTRVFIDLDPCFTQLRLPPANAPSVSGYASPHEFQFHFTCGERIGKPDCPIPAGGLQWRPTRIPVVVDMFTPRYTPEATRFTTVLSWSAYGSVQYQGEVYGPKSTEMLKILDLPRRAGPVFEIALAGPDAPAEQLRAAGWIISSALDATITVEAYQDHIGRSRGEFSVAKNAYVKSKCGVFLDRSVSYLAMGKPVILQDTGFSEILPCGEGLFAFRNSDDVLIAIETIGRDYARHCKAARRIAEEYFDSDKVLGTMLRQCDLPVTS